MRKVLGKLVKLRNISTYPDVLKIQAEAREVLSESDARFASTRTAIEERKVRLLDARRRRTEAEAAARACLLPVIQPLKDQNMSFRQIAEELNRQGVKSPKGGEWKAGSVHSLLKKA